MFHLLTVVKYGIIPVQTWTLSEQVSQMLTGQKQCLDDQLKFFTDCLLNIFNNFVPNHILTVKEKDALPSIHPYYLSSRVIMFEMPLEIPQEAIKVFLGENYPPQLHSVHTNCLI